MLEYYRDAVMYYHRQDVQQNESFPDLNLIDVGPHLWEEMCQHPLQPLRYCLESVRIEFLHLARVSALFPPSLIDSLQKSMDNHVHTKPLERLAAKATPRRKKKPIAIQTDVMKMIQARQTNDMAAAAVERTKTRMEGGVGGLGHGSNPLDSFFPFDPYLLCRSNSYVEQYYRDWEKTEEDDNGLIVLNEEEDDISVASSNSDSDSNLDLSHHDHMKEVEPMSYTSTSSMDYYRQYSEKMIMDRSED